MSQSRQTARSPRSAQAVGRVTGPIVGGTHGWPFAAAGRDRLPEGYVEEEYFLEGDAVQFALAPGGEYAHDGRWDVVEREPSRFRTRFMVRRPIDPARFSGTVVVNWNNVSLGFEFPGRLRDEQSEVVASGSAWWVRRCSGSGSVASRPPKNAG